MLYLNTSKTELKFSTNPSVLIYIDRKKDIQDYSRISSWTYSFIPGFLDEANSFSYNYNGFYLEDDIFQPTHCDFVMTQDCETE